MSELKAFDIVVSEEGYGEGIVKYRRAVYDESEADKVIAEKDAIIEKQEKEIKFMHQNCKHGEHCGTSCAQIHGELMQATIEIAELKQKINESQTELELWRDGSIISETHQKELDEKRHSDYKRCLAMAMWCRSRACFYDTMRENSLYWGMKSDRAYKWHKRWLELAERFK